MFDVNLLSARISDRGGVAQYAAQDFETQQVGPVVPFTYDFQSGFVSFGYDFISDNPILFNGLDSQDMEGLPVGVITQIPATVPSPTGVPMFVELFVGAINPFVYDFGDDDLKSYPEGNITMLNLSQSSGDIEMGIGNTYAVPK